MIARLAKKIDALAQPTKATMATIANAAQPIGSGGDSNVLRAIEELQAKICRIETERAPRRGAWRSAGGEEEREWCIFHKKFKHKAYKCRTPCPKYDPNIFTINLGSGYYSKSPELIEREKASQSQNTEQSYNRQANQSLSYTARASGYQPNAPMQPMANANLPYGYMAIPINQQHTPMVNLPQHHVQTIATAPVVPQPTGLPPANPYVDALANLAAAVDGLTKAQSTTPGHPF